MATLPNALNPLRLGPGRQRKPQFRLPLLLPRLSATLAAVNGYQIRLLDLCFTNRTDAQLRIYMQPQIEAGPAEEMAAGGDDGIAGDLEADVAVEVGRAIALQSLGDEGICGRISIFFVTEGGAAAEVFFLHSCGFDRGSFFLGLRSESCGRIVVVERVSHRERNGSRFEDPNGTREKEIAKTLAA